VAYKTETHVIINVKALNLRAFGPQPVAWLHPFFIHHCTANGSGFAASMLAVRASIFA